MWEIGEGVVGEVMKKTHWIIANNNDNTVEVYCGDFYDGFGSDDGISIEYIYGETFEITEEQK